LIVLGVIGVLHGDFIGGVWRFLIGMFLRGAAQASYEQTMAQRLLAGVSVQQVMTPAPVALPPDLSIARFIEDYVYSCHHREFPVAREGVLIGIIGTRQVAALDRQRWADTVVADLAVAPTPSDTIRPEAGALETITQMSSSGRSRLFVVRDGQLVGIVCHRDLIELVSVKLELIGDRSSPRSLRRA
jgi:CBS-domain-containing membrane protein